MDVSLFGERVFTGVIRDLEMGSSWINAASLPGLAVPKSYGTWTYEKQTGRSRTQHSRPCEDRGRDEVMGPQGKE